MTGKERVQAVMRGEIPDRVPWGEYAIDYDTVERLLGHETYLRAKAKSTMALWEGRRDEVVQSWREDLIALYRQLDFLDIVNTAAMCTAVAPPRGYEPERPRRVDETTWEFADGRVMKYSPVTADLTLVHDPQEWTREFRVEDYPTEPRVVPPAPEQVEVLDAVVAELGQDRYIIGPCGGEVALPLLGGLQRGLVECLENEEVVTQAGRHFMALARAKDDFWERPAVDGWMWGQDFAHNGGPFISPALFRRLALPLARARVEDAHRRGKKVFKHACGNNRTLLDAFVEIGYDCYQSIQASAGMSLDWLKPAYGDRLVLWGGVSVENLMSGTPSDIKEEVARAMEVGKPGGRYIFGSSHSIAVGCRYENFMAMVEAYQELCRYT